MFANNFSLNLGLCTLVVLLLGLQYQLWVGDGSFAEVFSLEHSIAAQKQQNEALRERNLALDAEVRDLKTALDAVEERARLELGMIRQGEVFYRVVEPVRSKGAKPR